MEYTTIEGVAGQYFQCDRYRATLSVDRCTSMFRLAKKNRSDPLQLHDKCLGCHIGAGHAGETVESSRTFAHGMLTCCRCHTQAARLLQGGICVSCFNRAREVEKGCNAKGLPPMPSDVFFGTSCVYRGKGKTVVLHNVAIKVHDKSRVRPITYRSSTMLEAALRAFRASPEAIVARADRAPAMSRWVQLSLFGGL